MSEGDEGGDLINKFNEAITELHNLLRKSHDEHLDVFLRREITKYASKEMLGRMLAAEELLTIMAHDLRNYLTPLKGRLELVERRARREGRERDVQDTTAAAKTLNLLGRVISDLLDVARLNQGIFTIHPRPINLVDLVLEVVPAFSRPETPIHIHAPQEVVLAADPDRLRQVLENLLANAVKFAPQHTPIMVQLDRQSRMDGPWMCLSVSNAGPGLPSELHAQLPQPFVAEMTSTGLGLGLYLANRIAAARFGTLAVDSPQGQGVRVTLALPMEEDEDVNECYNEGRNAFS